mmetsp:Transcript_5087/g.7165  ORF Transcript_5087/g.7165 Transcript_5087/m.7165 type:complete len:668 (+) Transcript_5087:227-2230(+)
MGFENKAHVKRIIRVQAFQDIATLVLVASMILLLLTPSQALLSTNPSRLSIRVNHISRSCKARKPNYLSRSSFDCSARGYTNVVPRQLKDKWVNNPSKVTALLSTIAGENELEEEGSDDTFIPLKEDEDFKAAVEEVKGAAKNVTLSTVNLTSTIVTNGPSILGRLIGCIATKGLRDDIQRRRKCYTSDWTDAFNNKRQCIPAILFLYFACLAPVVSFGTIASQITEGSIGVVEFLIASGGAGMVYSILSGQPMAFVAPTGLTLAFMSGLYRYCTLQGLAFLPIYTWVGLWTSGFMMMLGFRGASKYIRFCTRFTDEVFNGLLSLNFLYEASASLRRNFMLADPMNLSMPFVSLSMALGTFWSTTQVIALEKSMYFTAKIRKSFKDFGPVAIIIIFSALNQMRSVKKFGVPTLSVPNTFELAGGRDFLIPFKTVPVNLRILCALPAILLTSLFFMDQNISARVVNREENKLEKGAAYNLDMVALGMITGVLSIFGLPWMCGATVQSMNHVRAMTSRKFDEKTGEMEIDHVTETRATGFAIHAMLAATIGLLPLLTHLPIPVVSGVFLFLSRKLMTGNTFLKRMLESVAEAKRLPSEHPVNILGRKKMNIFTVVQILCLTGLWTFKQNSATAIFFPGVIGLLMGIRAWILPRYFTEEEFCALGDPTPL